MKGSDIDPRLLERAKALYMDFTPIVEIVKETGIKRATLNYHIHRKETSWKNIREGAKLEMLEAFSEAKKGKLIDVNKLCLKIIHKGLQDLSKQETVSLQDAKMAANILTEMDKIIKLDDGEATSRSETLVNKPASIEDMRRRLQSADPFMETEVPPDEIKEIEQKDSDITDTNTTD